MPAQPSNQFTTSDIDKFRTWYEKWVYTGFSFDGASTSDLGTGSTSLIADTRDWNPVDGEFTLEIGLEMLQATSNAGLLYTWTNDPQNVLNAGNNQGYTSAFPAGQRQVPTDTRAVEVMQLGLANASGAAIAGAQANYAASLRRLTVAEKLAAQSLGLIGYDLTTKEQQALASLGLSADTGALADLIHKGSQPHLFRRNLEAVWRNRFVQEQWDFYSISVSSAGATPLNYVASRTGLAGRVLLLTGLMAPGAPNVTLTLSRDNVQAFRAVNLAGFAQTDDSPWVEWIPATQRLTFNLTLGPGNSTTTTATLGLRVAVVDLSEILAVQLGLAKSGSVLKNPATYAKTLVGLV